MDKTIDFSDASADNSSTRHYGIFERERIPQPANRTELFIILQRPAVVTAGPYYGETSSGNHGYCGRPGTINRLRTAH